jgi:hypothetical protein
MKLKEFKETPREIRDAAFVTAKKDWLSILLHDWYGGDHDEHIDEFLAKEGVDIFNPSDSDIAVAFGKFVAGKV